MISSIDCFVSLETETALDKDETRRWFQCVRANTPSGVMCTTQITDDQGGRQPVALIHAQEGPVHGYVVPLTRNLTPEEGERIVAAYEPPNGIQIDIAISSSIEQKDEQAETISIDQERYAGLCVAWAKRQHETWMADRIAAGWSYGIAVSQGLRTHPLLQAWDELPNEARGVDLEAPQKMVDLLNDQGYAIISRNELDSIKTLLRQQALTETVVREAPIDNFELLGDFNKSSSFRHEQDRKLLTNPKAVEKIKAKWARTEQPFNMYFVNSAEANRHTEVGMVDQAWLEKNMPKTFPLLDIRGDAINILFTNNKGAEREPMTAWVISHRFGHVVSKYAGQRGRQLPEFTEARRTIVRTVSEILKCYGQHVPDRETDYAGMAKANNLLKWFYQAVGTMRSARENAIRNEFEFTLELLSQYMLTGSIKFNPLPKSFKWGSTTAYFRGSEQDYRECAYLLEGMPEQLEDVFSGLLWGCVGRTFVM